MNRTYTNTFLFVAVLAALLLAVESLWGSHVLQDPPTTAITQQQQDASLRPIQLGNQTVRVTVADTPELRQVGLGGRNGLAPDEGMLFVFPQDGAYGFWMKDMRFSIDILWLSADGRIVYMVQNISPDTYPQNFVPTTPALYVLELPAGFAASHHVVVGDVAQI